MQGSGSTHRPEGAGAFRRALLAARAGADDQPRLTGAERRIIDTLQQAIDERLDDGLHAIEEQATDLMREVASEVWRASASDVRPEQERIVSLLSRDQAIRSLITSSDERFQALALRASRLEDALTDLAETGRTTRRAMEVSAQSIREISGSPTLHGVEAVRTQLEQVEHHIAAAFEHLDERDRLLTGTVLQQVREHGELVAQETARIVEVMQAYVQSGTEAVGRLAERVEAHTETFAAYDDALTEAIRASADEGIRAIGEQLEMVSERMGIEHRSLAELPAGIERMVEATSLRLAQLIRSDSEALRALIEHRTQQQERAIREALAEGMVAERQALEERMLALGETIDRRIQTLDATSGEQMTALAAAVVGAVERTFERMSASVEAIDGVDTMLAESQAAAEERMMDRIDERITTIARLIRSDNRVLAEQLARIETPAASTEGADAELLRHTIRAVKELQAGLASDVTTSVDRRFQAVSDQLHKETQSTTEAMVKVAEVLGQKMDRLSLKVDAGEGDLQIVIDRMSDAIQAISRVPRERRLEID